MELDVGPQRTSPGQFLLIQVVEETAHWNMGKELALDGFLALSCITLHFSGMGSVARQEKIYKPSL